MSKPTYRYNAYRADGSGCCAGNDANFPRCGRCAPRVADSAPPPPLAPAPMTAAAPSRKDESMFDHTAPSPPDLYGRIRAAHGIAPAAPVSPVVPSAPVAPVAAASANDTTAPPPPSVYDLVKAAAKGANR